MAKANVVFSNDNEYYTPKSVVNYFGKFDYDPATTIEKAKDLGIENFDTIETDGLKSDWTKYKRIWINPPFSIKTDFIKKAYDTYAKNPYIYIYILFPIEYLTTNNFMKATQGVGGKIFIPNGRINFQSGLGKKGKSPAFGSVVMLVQDKWEIEFIDKNDLKENYEQIKLEENNE